MRGLLFVVSGPSGAGKGTICKALTAKRPDIHLSISCATRAPRPGEADGVDYYFISEEEFARMAENGEFLECAGVHGHHYGTPRAKVEEALAAGRDVILEIDVQGGMQVLKQNPEMTGVFVLPPSFAVLKSRLTGRQTESAEVIDLRLHNALYELDCARHYPFLLVNDELDRAVAELEEIIASRRANRDLLDQLTAQFKEGLL